MMESMFSIQELLDFVLLLPLAFSLLAASGFFKGRILHWADRLTATLVALAVWQVVVLFPVDSAIHDGFIYLDALSLWMLLILSLLYVAFSWTSKAYLERDTNIRYGYLRRFSHLEGRFYALSPPPPE